MFAPPAVIETEVFCRLPDEFRNPHPTEWSTINGRGEHPPCFLEGPSFDREGNLYFVDIPYGRIFKATPSGQISLVVQYDGEPNGLKIRKDGQIFIADYKNGIMQLDPTSGEVKPHCTRHRLEAFKGCNDLVFHSNGDMYFTDQGQTGLQDPSGRVFKLTPEGDLSIVLAGIPSPNGLVFNPEESVLYVAVTRDNSVWRLPLMPDGGVSKVGVFLQLSGGLGGPDGMAMDVDGNISVCHAGLGVAWLFSRIGEPLYRIQSREGLMTTNIAYGGMDNRTAYITESTNGHILRAELPTAGVPMYSHA